MPTVVDMTRSASDRPSEIYALLIPLAGERLLVPRGCVAEVVGYHAPQEMTGAPPWYLGLISWNGRQVPLVSFEGACGLQIEPPVPRSRVVVLNAVSNQLEAGQVAVLSQGFPQLVRITTELVTLDSDRKFDPTAPVMCQAHVLNESPLIPDFDRLESMVAAFTRPI